MVSAIAEDKPPKFAATDSDLFRKVKHKMAQFLFVESSGSSGEAGKTLTGRSAAKHLYDKIAIDTKDSRSDVTLQVLRPLCVFSWLLDKTQQGQLLKWESEILVQGAAAMPSGSKTFEKKSKKGSSKKHDTDALVASLFK
ncbi:unnamed protein product [Polarella glacialis]|uniref:Uncharacterized protein n=1 Tax=Polarella glacialis TaxID=89957 RepID=A0A813FPB3_POLGL|nr:unnamed protein product [Polarella glacialis]